MSRYLIVTHQTARSAELQNKVAEVVASDPEAEFVILVPESSGQHVSWEGESTDLAQQRGEAAASQLRQQTGARVVRTTTGSADPMKAIKAELSKNKDYDKLMICTLPLGASRWLRRDLIHEAQRTFGLPVIHVVAQAS